MEQIRGMGKFSGKRSGLLVVLLLTSFLALSVIPQESGKSGEVNEVNVIVIGVDFFRSDHMPCNGYPYNTTPNLCEFASENVYFKKGIASAGWTHPSVGSLFTAQYPATHGLKESNTRLNNRSTTLAEFLNRRGYRTVAFPGLSKQAVGSRQDSKEFQLLPRYNLYKGFDNYSAKGPFLSSSVPPAIRFLRNETRNESFFMYVQGFDPIKYKSTGLYTRSKLNWDKFDPGYDGILHNPEIMNKSGALSNSIFRNNSGLYIGLQNGTGIEIGEEDVEHIRAHYDYALYLADRRVGRILDVLRQEGLMNRTVVVFQSSHGVYLDDSPDEMNVNLKSGERVFGHAGVTEPELHVPFIIHVPGESSRVIDEPVSHVDIMPTVLDLLDFRIPVGLEKAMQGESLENAIIEGSATSDGVVYSVGGWGFESVHTGNWKLVVTRSGERMLFKVNGEIRRTNSTDVEERLDNLYRGWRLENLQ